jgi:hypothetical protein
MRLLKQDETLLSLLESGELTLNTIRKVYSEVLVDCHDGKYPGRSNLDLSGLTPGQVTHMHQNQVSLVNTFAAAMKKKPGSGEGPMPMASSRQSESRV